MKRVGIVAALPGELKPLITGWQKLDGSAWSGEISGMQCIAVAGGMGSDAAARTCERIFAAGPVDAMMSVGWAGSLSCGAKPPDAYEVSEVIDAQTGERFSTGQEQGLRLVTLGHVAGVAEKRRLAESYRAVMVDMEAAAVARLARTRNLPFLCCKGISDGATDVLPDFSKFIGHHGQMQMGAFLAHVAVRPHYWKNLARMGSNSRKAAVALRELVTEVLKRPVEL